MNNRIRQYLDNEDIPPTPSKCLVIVARSGQSVYLSYQGKIINWTWNDAPDGVRFSEREDLFEVDPMASESFVAGEVAGYISNLDIDADNVVFTDEMGIAVENLTFHPKILGPITEELQEKKRHLTYLYLMFATNSAELTEDILGQAQKFGVLKPFLSLINLYR